MWLPYSVSQARGGRSWTVIVLAMVFAVVLGMALHAAWELNV
jgi:hypothetical protein